MSDQTHPGGTSNLISRLAQAFGIPCHSNPFPVNLNNTSKYSKQITISRPGCLILSSEDGTFWPYHRVLYARLKRWVLARAVGWYRLHLNPSTVSSESHIAAGERSSWCQNDRAYSHRRYFTFLRVPRIATGGMSTLVGESTDTLLDYSMDHLICRLQVPQYRVDV